MADFASSLPVRTESAGDLEIKIVDATVTSQKLKVESDGSINTNTTITATDLDIRDLVFATDKVDVSGSEVSLDTATLAALENITVSATDLDIRDLAFATDKVDVSGSEISLDTATLAALENITVSATDLDIRDLSHAQDSVKVGDGTDFLAIRSNGSVDANILETGATVADFNTAAEVAANATSTHTYTSTGNFYLEQIEASASGRLKIVVKVNAATKFTKISSSSNPNLTITLKRGILATTGQTVTVERTNLDKSAEDVYSTIMGRTE